MDPIFAFLDTFRTWFQNIGILVMLILLYNLIPNRIFLQKKLQFSLLVGIIFSFAAIMGIFIPWSGTSYPIIGMNGVLVPLAGLVGGLVSAGIITGILLFIRVFFEGGIEGTADVFIFLFAAVIGSVFHAIRGRYSFKFSLVWDLLVLSSIFAGITILIISMMTPVPVGDYGNKPLHEAEIAIIIFIGLFLLGIIIQSIDRKKEGECELIRYQRHLEALVHERTSDLEQINSLQQATIESTADGIVVVDLEGKVSGYNKIAAIMLDIRSPEEMNESELDIMRLLLYHVSDPEVFSRMQSPLSLSTQLFTTELTFRSGRIYELYMTPYQLREETLGRVLNFREITDKKHAEDSLMQMNQKLLLLSGITRHDILNQITALKLYLYLIRNESPDTGIGEYLERASQILKVMQFHTEATGDYQDVGFHEPVWQSPGDVFTRVARSFADCAIRISSDLSDLEILADPLLERAFYNLVDNSIRHGGHVSSISLSGSYEDEVLILVYRDDGNGVPSDEKEKIFLKGFGKHTGFGMFLIQEILSITGISIRENGLFGEGARFEILVPKGISQRQGYRSP